MLLSQVGRRTLPCFEIACSVVLALILLVLPAAGACHFVTLAESDIGGKSSFCSLKPDDAAAPSSVIDAAHLARLTSAGWEKPYGPGPRFVGLLPPECVITEYETLPLRTLPSFDDGLTRRSAPSGRCVPHVPLPRGQWSTASSSGAAESLEQVLGATRDE